MSCGLIGCFGPPEESISVPCYPFSLDRTRRRRHDQGMIRITTVAVLAFLIVAHPARGAGAELIEVKKIWDQAPHNAFTGLLKWKDAWYCVFREGSGHIPGTDGKIRLLRSTDGEKWESAALIAEKTVDLREPKICVTPDERLMIVMGGLVY